MTDILEHQAKSTDIKVDIQFKNFDD